MTSPLIGTSVELTISNLARGQVAEIAVSERLDDRAWTALETRLISIMSVRQPSELRLDIDGTGEVHRFAAGLGIVADALAAHGGALTLPDAPGRNEG